MLGFESECAFMDIQVLQNLAVNKLKAPDSISEIWCKGTAFYWDYQRIISQFFPNYFPITFDFVALFAGYSDLL